ncbi:YidC/Oxa1 family membrane protein insertase [Candidatus Peregrinibacteria bacterium]|nr:MAG: YidC/Oxa1 family membrane protein insertase [Candidatus Peregrinibacteria bacterium]
MLVVQWFGAKQNQQGNSSTEDVVIAGASSFKVGKPVIVELKNQTDQALVIGPHCPSQPLTVEQYRNGEWIEKSATTHNTSGCVEQESIAPQSSQKISYQLWNYDLFGEPGRYRISYEVNLGGKNKIFYKEIEIKESGMIGNLNREIFYRPIFNVLVFLIDALPNHNLGWAVILLTLIMRLILLIPNQKALKAQKAMQKVQPELDAIRKKYQDKPQEMAQRTMEVWKKHKVSPAGSCLPMLIQLPILLSLFFVVRDGLGSFNPDLLYANLKHFDANSIQTVFLGILDVSKVNWQVLPLIIGGLQFIQIKMSFTSKGANKDQPVAMMNQMMPIIMPVMIAIFTATLPAAVAFYWGTSTLFAIGQQWVVNRS